MSQSAKYPQWDFQVCKMRANAHSTSKYQWPLDNLCVKFLRTRLIGHWSYQSYLNEPHIWSRLDDSEAYKGAVLRAWSSWWCFFFYKSDYTTGDEKIKLDFFVSVSCCTFFSALSLSLLLLSPASWFSGRVFAFSQFFSFQKGPLKWWDFEITCFVFWFPRDPKRCCEDVLTGPLPAQAYWPCLQSGRGVHQSNRSPNLEMQRVKGCQGFGSDWAPALFPNSNQSDRFECWKSSVYTATLVQSDENTGDEACNGRKWLVPVDITAAICSCAEV